MTQDKDDARARHGDAPLFVSDEDLVFGEEWEQWRQEIGDIRTRIWLERQKRVQRPRSETSRTD